MTEKETSRRVRQTLASYTPAAATVGVVAFSAFLYSRLLLCQPEGSQCVTHVTHFDPDIASRGYAELDAHITWAAAVFVFVLVAASTILVAGWSYVTSKGERKCTWSAWGLDFALIAVVLLLVWTSPSFDPLISLDSMYLSPTVYEVFRPAQAGVRLVEIFASLAIAVTVLAVCGILGAADAQAEDPRVRGGRTPDPGVQGGAVPDPGVQGGAVPDPGVQGGLPQPARPNPAAERRASVFAGRIADLRTLLRLAAVLTVLGVIEVSTLYSWAGTMISSDSAAKARADIAKARADTAKARADTAKTRADSAKAEVRAAARARADTAKARADTAKARADTLKAVPSYLDKTASVSTTATMLAGVFYSVLLCAIFIPAFAVIQRRLNALAESAEPNGSPAKRSQWLTTRNLSLDLPKQLATITALAGPALVGGPINVLLKALTG